MSGLLGGVLPAIFSQADRAKRYIGGLLADPVGRMQQAGGQAVDDLSKLGLLSEQAFNDPKNPMKLQDNAAARQLTDTYLNSVMNFAPVGMHVWHGSPHKFDRFDSSKIGTGEGAQAYGHGLYLAESPDVAKQYQDKLTDPAFKYAGMNEAKMRLNEKIAKRVEKTDPARAAALRAEVASLGEPGGALYKVDLPDDAIAKMLDWDKPLSQQAPEVRSALQSMTNDVVSGGFDLTRAARNPKLAFDDSARGAAFEQLKSKYGITERGGQFFDKGGRQIPKESVDRQLEKLAGKGYERAGDLYSDLAHIVGSQAQVSSVMRNQGIPGIRYLDGGSRGTGAGTSNFVVFPGNEGLLSILERNGQPLR